MSFRVPWGRWFEPWKAFLDPRTYRTYRHVKREHPHATGGGGSRREVLIDITRHSLDRDVGRIAYFVFALFFWSGFRVCLRDRFRFLGTMQRKLYKRLLLQHPFEVVPGPGAMHPGFWWVTDRVPADVPIGCARLVVLDYAHRVPRPDEIVLPYMFNPTVYEHLGGTDLSRYRASERPYRVFFAGTVNRKYNRDTLPKRYGLLSRCQVLDQVRRHFSEAELIVIRSFEDLRGKGSAAFGKIVLLAPDSELMTVEQWLTVLGRSQVLLAAPGVSMPLSHNLWEAMALGTVPLLEYPRQLFPPLEDGTHAFVFSGGAGLEERLRSILRLGAAGFEPLRERCLEYYHRYGAIEAFLERLDSLSSRRADVLVFPYEAVRAS